MQAFKLPSVVPLHSPQGVITNRRHSHAETEPVIYGREGETIFRVSGEIQKTRTREEEAGKIKSPAGTCGILFLETQQFQKTGISPEQLVFPPVGGVNLLPEAEFPELWRSVQKRPTTSSTELTGNIAKISASVHFFL
jgi:hypothetical protein